MSIPCFTFIRHPSILHPMSKKKPTPSLGDKGVLYYRVEPEIRDMMAVIANHEHRTQTAAIQLMIEARYREVQAEQAPESQE